LSREERTTLLLTGLRKRIRGRLASLPDIERIVKEIAPLVAAAAEQPEVQPIFAQIAEEESSIQEEVKAHWIALQEADLLLESGGEADSVSVSDAVGVAQWLAGTARGVGLKVDLPASRRMTQEIEALRLRIAWIDYLQRPDARCAQVGRFGFRAAARTLADVGEFAATPTRRRCPVRPGAGDRRADTLPAADISPLSQ
jgi:hypothetical protein